MSDKMALLLVNLLIWGGLFAYLAWLDSQVRRLRK